MNQCHYVFVMKVAFSRGFLHGLENCQRQHCNELSTKILIQFMNNSCDPRGIQQTRSCTGTMMHLCRALICALGSSARVRWQKKDNYRRCSTGHETEPHHCIWATAIQLKRNYKHLPSLYHCTSMHMHQFLAL